jgi:hypothetical protein
MSPNIWLWLYTLFSVEVLVLAYKERCPLLCPKGQESPRNCSQWPEAHCVECEDGKHKPYDDVSTGDHTVCIENNPCSSIGQYVESVNKVDGSICGCKEGYVKNVNDDTYRCYQCYCCDDVTTAIDHTSACSNNTNGAVCSYGTQTSQCTTSSPINTTPNDTTAAKPTQHIIVAKPAESLEIGIFVAVVLCGSAVVVLLLSVCCCILPLRRSQKYTEQMVQEALANCSIEAEEEGKKRRVIFNPTKKLHDLCKRVMPTSDVGVTQMEQEQRRTLIKYSPDALDEQPNSDFRSSDDHSSLTTEYSREEGEETSLFVQLVAEKAYCPEDRVPMPIARHGINTDHENEVNKENDVEPDEPVVLLLPDVISGAAGCGKTDNTKNREAATLLSSLQKNGVKMIIFEEGGCWILDDKKWLSSYDRKLVSCNRYDLDKYKKNTSPEFVASLHMDVYWELSMLLDVPQHPGLTKGDYRALADAFELECYVIDHLVVHYLKWWGSPTLELFRLLIEMKPPITCTELIKKLLYIKRKDCAKKVAEASGIDFHLLDDESAKSNDLNESV